MAIEVETGKSNTKTNLAKIKKADCDRIVVVATSPTAVAGCQKAIDSFEQKKTVRVELLTWLDVS